MNLLVVSRITDNLNPTDPISTRISTHQNPTDSIFSRISYSQNPNSYDYSGNMGCQVFKEEIQNYCTPSPRVTRILVPETHRAMRKPC